MSLSTKSISPALVCSLKSLLVEKGVPYEAILEELASREGVISKTQERKAITDL